MRIPFELTQDTEDEHENNPKNIIKNTLDWLSWNMVGAAGIARRHRKIKMDEAKFNKSAETIQGQ